MTQSIKLSVLSLLASAFLATSAPKAEACWWWGWGCCRPAACCYRPAACCYRPCCTNPCACGTNPCSCPTGGCASGACSASLAPPAAYSYASNLSLPIGPVTMKQAAPVRRPAAPQREVVLRQTARRRTVQRDVTAPRTTRADVRRSTRRADEQPRARRATILDARLVVGVARG